MVEEGKPAPAFELTSDSVVDPNYDMSSISAIAHSEGGASDLREKVTFGPGSRTLGFEPTELVSASQSSLEFRRL